jgi:hypothetical protein
MRVIFSSTTQLICEFHTPWALVPSLRRFAFEHAFDSRLRVKPPSPITQTLLRPGSLSARTNPNPAQSARASAPRDPQNTVFTPARIFHPRISHVPIFGNAGNTLVTPPKPRRNHTSDSAHPSSSKSGDSREIRAATPRSQPHAWCAQGGCKTLFAPFRNPFATSAQQTRVG